MRIYSILLTAFLTCISTLAHAQIPSSPTNLMSAVGGKITLTWVDNSTDELCFPLEVKLPNTTEWKLISCVSRNATSFVDGRYLPGEYCYRVKAINNAGDSSYSNEACATLVPPKPQSPSLLTSKGTGANIITWQPVDEAISIHIYRRLGQTGSWGYRDKESAQFGIWFDRTVADGVEYCYRAKFINLGGESNDSAVMCQK